MLHYRDIGDYLSREDKLAIVADSTLESVPWETITPNADGDWVHQRTADFAAFTPIGGVDTGRQEPVFRLHSRGLATARDA